MAPEQFQSDDRTLALKHAYVALAKALIDSGALSVHRLSRRLADARRELEASREFDAVRALAWIAGDVARS